MTRPSLADVTAGRGLLFGGDYNPEQWSPQVWREDVALMRAAGVNLVTVGVFSWSRLEPQRGRFEFGWLREVLDLLHEAGIAVDLATPTASPPPWLAVEHPDTLPITAEGVRLSYGSRNQFSASAPAYREAALAVSRAVVAEFASHPAVVMWHVGNELGQVDYGEHAAAAFRRWLERRYADVEELNREWATAVWSQGYRSFAEVLPPRAAPYHRNPSQDLDFRRFTSDELLSLYRDQAAVIREVDQNRPITTNFMGFFPLADYASWAGDLDVISDDAYPDPGDPHAPADAALTQHLMRSLGGGAPWLLMESATSAVSWRPHNLTRSPAAMRRSSLQAVANGADGVCFFQWRAARSGPERFHSAMLPIAGADTAVHRGVRRLGADLARLASVAGTRTTARVALVWDWPAWWAASGQAMPTDRLDPLATLRAWHRVLWAAHVPVDVVGPGADLSGYSCVLAPSLYVVTPEWAENLRGYVAGGGTFVLGPFSAVADAGAHLHLGPFPALLRDVLGVAGEEWVPLPEDGVPGRWVDGGAEFRVLTYAEHTRADGAEPVAALSAAPGAEQLGGSVAVARHRFGRGTAWYVGAVLPETELADLLARVLAEAGVVPAADAAVPAGVEVTSRGGSTFVLNHTGEQVAITLSEITGVTGDVLDLLTEATHRLGDRLSLERDGVAVLVPSA